MSPKSHPGSEQSSGDTENTSSLAHSATTLEPRGGVPSDAASKAEGGRQEGEEPGMGHGHLVPQQHPHEAYSLASTSPELGGPTLYQLVPGGVPVTSSACHPKGLSRQPTK